MSVSHFHSSRSSYTTLGPSFSHVHHERSLRPRRRIASLLRPGSSRNVEAARLVEVPDRGQVDAVICILGSQGRNVTSLYQVLEIRIQRLSRHIFLSQPSPYSAGAKFYDLLRNYRTRIPECMVRMIQLGRPFEVNQMDDNIECTPGVRAFIAQGPAFRQTAQQGIKNGRGTAKQRNCPRQIMFHHAPRFGSL